MKVNGFASVLAAGLLAIGAASSASAAEQTGLVNVNLENVRVIIAKEINVDVSQVPVTVQAPISVAANVCGVDVNVLAKQRDTGKVECTANSTSTALNQIVQKQVKKTK